MIEYDWQTFKVRTVWCIAHESAPASLRSLDETQFHLDLAHDETTLFWIDLALERLELELLISVLVHHLAGKDIVDERPVPQ